MAKLSFQERKVIEDFLGMGGGYVLDFSDRTIRDFIGDCLSIDFDNAKYQLDGTSKAKRLRAFMAVEDDHTVGVLFRHLHDYKLAEWTRRGIELNRVDAEQFLKIAHRLLEGKVIPEIEAIQANNDDRDFHQLAKLIRESINQNEPESALDRLHVFLIKFLKELCASHSVEVEKDEVVNALYGKYVKTIKAKGLIDSVMAEKILNFSFQVIQAFNDVRNNKSFAHDNPILNYDESVLIFSNITATVKFLQAMEAKHKNTAIAEAKPDWGLF